MLTCRFLIFYLCRICAFCDETHADKFVNFYFFNLKGPLHVFYGLTNFFQNHRRYVMSRDDEQLNGKLITVPSADCEPYRYNENGGTRKIIAPCGAIANSLFNGTNGIQ